MKRSIIAGGLALALGAGATRADVIHYEGFESGTLGGWTLSTNEGANPWINSNVNPYTGARHAYVQPQDTLPRPASRMERTLSTVGFEDISFAYHRRVVGFDVADQFQVQWYDGSAWNTLEDTLGQSTNDQDYVFRSFTLPSGAANNPLFGVRFDATAGAVSEFVYLDQLFVEGQSIPSPGNGLYGLPLALAFRRRRKTT